MSTAHWQARRLPVLAAWPARSSPAAHAWAILSAGLAPIRRPAPRSSPLLARKITGTSWQPAHLDAHTELPDRIHIVLVRQQVGY